MMRWLMLPSICLLSLLGTVFMARAEGGFSVTPMFQEVTLVEGGDEAFIVSVVNDTEAIATFRLSVLDFGSLDESGGVAFLGAPGELEQRYALASWMRPETDTLTLAPKARANVSVTIENRPDLSPGGHYAGLLFTATGDGDMLGNGNKIALNQIFSVLVFAKKKGGELYGLEFTEHNWKKRLIWLDDKVYLRFRNTGNVHVTPRGRIELHDPLGRVVSSGIINEESAIVLPETFRLFPVTLREERQALIPGRHTLVIKHRFDGKEDFTVLEEGLVFLPPPAMLTILTLLVGGGWYVARRRRNTGDKGSRQSVA